LNASSTTFVESCPERTKERVSDRIVVFVISLQKEDRSLARRVYAAWFIKTYQREIEGVLSAAVCSPILPWKTRPGHRPPQLREAASAAAVA
jgi:hypothetical protein